ncbi:hypothetical protein PG989_006263 [Apiospora arundinis]|uniref:NACHT domain-containing protein n=1 Tax=Apiospora arundinis TaxID=335852 RepID=A0ABR2IW63_9PEZI
MDGFTALGIAANICQFVEYSFKILNKVKAVQKAGAVDHDLERDTRYLKEVAGKVAHQTSGHGGLDELTNDCTSLSEQLLGELSKIQPKDSRSKWQSFKAVVRSERKKHDMSDLEAKLERCRSQLTLQLTDLMSDLLTLRHSLEHLRPTMEAQYIGKDTTELIESFVNRMDKALNKVKQVSILNLVRFPGVHERFDLIADAHQNTFDWLLDEDEDEDEYKNVSTAPGSPETSVNGNDDIEGMSDSSGSTTDSTDSDINPSLIAARNSFISWLQDDGGVFWITGKPGAGKSTLMKYICLHENLTPYLDMWATGSGLALGRFFFWKPGTAAQKSIQGLFRGLLFSLLESSPDLIPTAFPDLWDMDEASTVALPVTLEYRDIIKAFRNVLQDALRTSKYKVAFFIDGLDEFEGRHLELLQELDSWVKTYPNHVKCCVSSREYSIFQEYLSVYPTIQLHKLTERDIRRSVEHRLNHIPGHLRLDSTGMKKIQEKVALKAEGVFLWVSLVLGSIEDGMFSGSSVSELVARIEHCPVELEDLFEQLLKSIHQADRKFAFSALKWVLYILRRRDEIANASAAPPTFLSPSERSHAMGLSLVEISALETTENDLWEKDFTDKNDWEVFIPTSCRKVYGKCKGLLEVRGNLDGENSMLEAHVALTHRSVIEFLETAHTRAFLDQGNTGFDPFQATMRGFLAFLKHNTSGLSSWTMSCTIIPGYRDLFTEDSTTGYVRFKFSRLFNLVLPEDYPHTLQLMEYLYRIDRLYEVPAPGNDKSTATVASSKLLLPSLAFGCYEYYDWLLGHGLLPTTRMEYSHEVQQCACLYQVIEPWEKLAMINSKLPILSSQSAQRYTRVMLQLTRLGADLNRVYKERKGRTYFPQWTIWQTSIFNMLLHTHYPLGRRVETLLMFRHIVDQFLRMGADPYLKILTPEGISKETEVSWLTPTTGWICFQLFSGVYLPTDWLWATTRTHLSRYDVFDYLERTLQEGEPAHLLIARATAPLLQATRDLEGALTLKTFLTIFFPENANHFKHLVDGLSRGSCVPDNDLPPPLERKSFADVTSESTSEP